jgi:hypothetical protein
MLNFPQHCAKVSPVARILGRFLQACGLVLAPMALFYYFEKAGQADEGRLAGMELTILASAAAIFITGRLLDR